jgi:phosphoribosylcarboxyaminoimidazole (NCAIR) mutase
VLDGVDALLSTVQMPGGVPVATFAVGPAGARNAAVFAGEMVAAARPDVAASLRRLREAGAEKVLAADREIRSDWDQSDG